MHNIHPCAYRICTVHMRYAHACICIYVHVSVRIGFSYELYPVHMSMYVLKRPYSYSMIQSDMHLCRGAYLHVFECIWSLHSCTYALILMCISVCTCGNLPVFQSCIQVHMHSLWCACLYVSACIS